MIKNMEWGAVAYLKQSKYGLGETDIQINSSSDYYTGGGSGIAYKSNINQSTTGNIYGVYDMSGNSHEYVMGNLVDNSGKFLVSSSGFNLNTIPEPKYYDIYNYGTLSEDHARGKLGDATKETFTTFGSTSGGWYDDFSYFTFTTNSWFIRGGKNSNDSNAGIFQFYRYNGYKYSDTSTRTILS